MELTNYFYISFLITFGILSAVFVVFCIFTLFCTTVFGTNEGKKEAKKDGGK